MRATKHELQTWKKVLGFENGRMGEFLRVVLFSLYFSKYCAPSTYYCFQCFLDYNPVDIHVNNKYPFVSNQMSSSSCVSRSFTGDVAFLNAPESPVSRWPLRILYTCAESSVVHVQVLVSFDTGSTVIVYHKYWICKPGRTRSRVVTLHFPDWLVYRPDWIIRGSDWVLSCLLRAWIGSDEFPEPDRFSLASVAVPLDVQPPLSRPFKKHLICANWAAALRRGDVWPQCAKENGKEFAV